MRRRDGFTLVEMLVALALSILIMAILSEGFVTGLKAFSQLKGLADMEQQLRTASTILRRDLNANHFDGSRRLSQSTASGRPIPSFTKPTPPAAPAWSAPNAAQLAPFVFVPPELGYFRINENTASLTEYANPLAPTLGTVRTPNYMDFDDEVQFTVRLAGNSRDQMFFGSVPTTLPGLGLDINSGLPHTRFDSAVANGVYASQWADVSYFLNADTSRAFGVQDNLGRPKMVSYFNLYRRQLLLVPDAFSGLLPQVVPTAGAGDTFANTQAYYDTYDLSAWQVGTNFFFNTPSDIQFPFRRYNLRWPAGSGPNTGRLMPIQGVRQGSDLLLSNVISFDVKVLDPLSTPEPASEVAPGFVQNLIEYTNRFVDIGNSFQVSAVVRGAFPPAVGNFFETGTNRVEAINGAMIHPLNPNLAGLQLRPSHALPFNMIKIIIRVHDPKTHQTREASFVVDM